MAVRSLVSARVHVFPQPNGFLYHLVVGNAMSRNWGEFVVESSDLANPGQVAARVREGLLALGAVDRVAGIVSAPLVDVEACARLFGKYAAQPLII